MTGMDSSHCQIVGKSISGQREIDEQTFASVAVLSERLERLKSSSRLFSEISFSPAVKRLARRKTAVAAF